MEKIIKYKCSECGDLFSLPELCTTHELRHYRIKKANHMFNQGYTLKEIQDRCSVWSFIPKYLENVNEDSYFQINHLPDCNKIACQIYYIDFDGNLNVYGFNSSDFYLEKFSLNDENLKDYIDKKNSKWRCNK